MRKLDWQTDVVRGTMEGAGQFPGVQLQLLLTRLEAHPDALPAIAAAIRDMGEWYAGHADALRDEHARRTGGNVATITTQN